MREIDPACLEPSAFWPRLIDGELASWRPAPKVPPTWPEPRQPIQSLQRRAKQLGKVAPHLPEGLLPALVEGVQISEMTAADARISPFLPSF